MSLGNTEFLKFRVAATPARQSAEGIFNNLISLERE